MTTPPVTGVGFALDDSDKGLNCFAKPGTGFSSLYEKG